MGACGDPDEGSPTVGAGEQHLDSPRHLAHQITAHRQLTDHLSLQLPEGASEYLGWVRSLLDPQTQTQPVSHLPSLGSKARASL